MKQIYDEIEKELKKDYKKTQRINDTLIHLPNQEIWISTSINNKKITIEYRNYPHKPINRRIDIQKYTPYKLKKKIDKLVEEIEQSMKDLKDEIPQNKQRWPCENTDTPGKPYYSTYYYY